VIFNDNVLFIHIGKTGGLSCSDYLLNNLQPPVYNCHADALRDAERYDSTEVIPVISVPRHAILAEAAAFTNDLKGMTLDMFKTIIAVVRNPYTLEHSYYQHLRKPRVRKRIMDSDPEILNLAAGDFGVFVERAGYHREDTRQEDFFTVDGEMPKNVTLLRFEDVRNSLPEAIANYRKAGPEFPFPHRNKSDYDNSLTELLTPEVEELIYQKHRYMFDSGIYQRAKL